MFRIIGFLLALFLTGCTELDSYEKMKELANKVKNNPSSGYALSKLFNYTKSHSKWDRFYAYVFLGGIAVEDVNNLRPKIVPFLVLGLKDKSAEIRRESVSAIRDCGSAAVDQAAPYLLEIIREGVNNDITWFSLEAVAALSEPDRIEEAIRTLFEVVKNKPEEGPEGMPQVRDYALDSIGKLSKKYNSDKIVECLWLVLTKDDLAFNRRVAQLILEISPHEKRAAEILKK